ncbi:MAG: TonB-dependent receptor plug domain-containing protein [Bacteroidetes bacterium]|nr:TonB-dependent receptor plug domain-containing protein [Bacteroidota bacterium]
MRYLFILILANTFIYTQSAIKGTALDSLTFQPVSNVNIIIENTDIGTATDDDGRFNINSDKDFPTVLVISHIGYKGKRVFVYGNKETTIYLTGNVIETDPINILGERKQIYGIMENYIHEIDGKDLRRKGFKDIGDALMASQSVNFQSSGWGRGEIRVRGSKASEVLLLKDGIKLNNPFLGVANTSKIDHYNIDNIQLIKGGQTVLYGQGNFGGVVLMNTHVPEATQIATLVGGGLDNHKELDNSIDGTLSTKYYRTRNYHTLTTRAYDGKTYNYKRNISSINRFRIFSIRADINYLNIHNLYQQQDGSILNGELINGYSGKITSTKYNIDFEHGRWNSNYENNIFSNTNFNNEEINKTYKLIKRIDFRGLDFILQYEKDNISSDRIITQKETETKSYFSYKSEIQSTANVIGYKIEDENVRLQFDLGYRLSFLNTDVSSSINSPYFNSILEDTKLASIRLGLAAEYLFFENKFHLVFYQGINEKSPSFLDYYLWGQGKIFVDETEPFVSEIDVQTIFNEYNELINEYMTTTELTFGVESTLSKTSHFISVFKNNYTNRVLYTNQLGITFPVNFHIPVWLSGFEFKSTIDVSDAILIKGSLSKVFYSDDLAFPSMPTFTSYITISKKIKWITIGIDNQYIGESFLISELGNRIHFKAKTFTHLRIAHEGDYKRLGYTISFSIRNIFAENYDITDSFYLNNSPTEYYEKKRSVLFVKFSYSL